MKIWDLIGRKYPVFYFDATGGLFNKIYGQQNPPFLFSLVSHDREERQIIPIAEFVTTGHTALDISQYLQKFSHFLDNSKLSFAPVIVTDFSYSLINAIMDAVNKCNLTHYVNWCFDILINHKDDANLRSVMKTRLILCSTHFLKSFIKKIKQIEKNKSKVSNTFILCFSLLQNSLTIEEFNERLLSIHEMFNVKYKDIYFFNCFATMETLLSEREINKTEIGNLIKVF